MYLQSMDAVVALLENVPDGCSLSPCVSPKPLNGSGAERNGERKWGNSQQNDLDFE